MRHLLWLLLFNFFCLIHTAEKIANKETTSTSYYSIENLQKLVEQGLQPHAPCLILFDPKNEDQKQNHAPVLMQNLQVAVLKNDFPIIASTSIFSGLVNFLINYSENVSLSEILKAIPLFVERWSLFVTPDFNFVVLIPKKFSQLFPSLGINTTFLREITHLLLHENDPNISAKSFTELKQLLEQFPQDFNNVLFFKEFSQIFIHNKENLSLPIWDFIITGHGLPQHTGISSETGKEITVPATFMGLSAHDFNKILSFMDNSLTVGVVLLHTCFIGGENLNLLERDSANILKKHSYILIALSTTDTPIVSIYSDNFKQFFEHAALLQSKGTLNQLLKVAGNMSRPEIIPSSVEHFKPSQLLSHWIRNSNMIPQTWLPNGMGFQTFNVDQFVFILGKVTEKISQENHKPIIIANKKAVLIYPRIIQSPLQISLFLQADRDPAILSMAAMKNITWKDMPMTTETVFWKNVPDSKLDEIIPKLEAEYGQLLGESGVAFIYPEFISMIRGNAEMYIKKIELMNPNSSIAGVIRFLRDAFLDIAPERLSTKTFLIEELHGYNDISLLMEASRLIKDIKQPHTLETILASYKNKPITLKHIAISTAKNHFLVAFSFEGTKWAFALEHVNTLWPSTHFWDIKELKDYSFESLKQKIFTEQISSDSVPESPKAISATLKEKENVMKRKKNLEIPRQEAAQRGAAAIYEYQRRMKEKKE